MDTNGTDVFQELIGAGDLPTLPVVVQQGLRLLSDDEVSLREVGELVASDPALGAKALRLVNSSLIGLRRPMHSIPDSVVYLGIEQMRNLLLSSSVVDTLDDRTADLAPYWEHAFGCGYVASKLSRLLGTGSSDDIYLGGLFHDLGRILLVVRCRDRYLDCLERAREAEAPLAELEESIFGVDHAELGARLAETWFFPAPVVRVVRHHHHPRRAESEAVKTALVRLADHLCWSRGLIDVPNDLEPLDLVEDECWTILREHATERAPLDPHRLLHEADTMVHAARLLADAMYTPP